MAETYYNKAIKEKKKFFFKNYDEIYENFMTAGKLFKNEKNYDKAVISFINAGDIAKIKNTFLDNISPYIECIEIYEKLNQYDNIILLVNYIVSIYINKNKFEDAGKFLSKKAEYMIKQKNYEIAIEFLTKSIDYLDTLDINDNIEIIKNMKSLLNLYNKLEKFNEATDINDKIINIYIKKNTFYTDNLSKPHIILLFLYKLIDINESNIMNYSEICENLLFTHKKYLGNNLYEKCLYLLKIINSDYDSIDYSLHSMITLSHKDILNDDLINIILKRIKSNLEGSR